MTPDSEKLAVLESEVKILQKNAEGASDFREKTLLRLQNLENSVEAIKKSLGLGRQTLLTIICGISVALILRYLPANAAPTPAYPTVDQIRLYHQLTDQGQNPLTEPYRSHRRRGE